ncbi:unnamed protein product [Schistosoma margrebowiei]|uniref:Uncharacterized protein n=1 Tax=Schistosoma margrebowiei TaxID=48269 RepID=A0A183LKK4_9TREM|nr:unnamed protein product [Schistosoma margrebowiei]
MVFGGSQQETMDLGFVPFGTHEQGISVVLRELMLSDGFDPVSPSFIVRDYMFNSTTEELKKQLGRNIQTSSSSSSLSSLSILFHHQS